MHAQAVVSGDYAASGKRKLYQDGIKIERTGVVQIPDEVAERVVTSSKVKLMTADEFAEHVTSASLIDTLKPLPAEGQPVKKDQVYNYKGQALVCYQDHARTHHDPLTVPALFGTAKGKADPWKQPLGAHDAYKLGAVVTHKGKTWESLIANNVWEPGSVGAENLWKTI
jgi:hypothetical protein